MMLLRMAKHSTAARLNKLSIEQELAKLPMKIQIYRSALSKVF
jgi:hypothetical protein